MKSEILEINEINDKECSVVYKVLNKRKNITYKKNSKKLLQCIDKYINTLKNKKKILQNKNAHHLLCKQVLTYIIVVLITLILVYFILTKCMNDNNITNTISYIGCLLLITCSFLIANLINYKSNLQLESEYIKLENDIIKAKDIKNNCILYVKSL